jgi:hypothetical protein
MKIVSEITGETYLTVDACIAAEKAFIEEQNKIEAEKKALAEKKKVRAAEVTEAYKAIEAAQKHYIELRNAFVKDYGYYHATFSNDEEQPIQGVSDLLNIIKTFIG